jgi:predicted peptidase
MRLAALLSCLLASTTGCASGRAGPVGGPAASRDNPGPGIHEQTLSLPDGQTVRYTLSIPDSYRDDRPSPLVVALHFGGRITPFYGRNILEGLVRPALADLDAIIVAPDALDHGWNDARDEAAVLALMDHLAAKLSIDPKRVLCTGFSMGGVGTWYLAARHPDRFTAAIPVAGRPVTDQPATAFKVPVFAIHGRLDEVMPLAATEAHIAALKASGSNAGLLIIDGVTHYQTDGFVEPLRSAVPWVRRVWGEATP